MLFLPVKRQGTRNDLWLRRLCDDDNVCHVPRLQVWNAYCTCRTKELSLWITPILSDRRGFALSGPSAGGGRIELELILSNLAWSGSSWKCSLATWAWRWAYFKQRGNDRRWDMSIIPTNKEQIQMIRKRMTSVLRDDGKCFRPLKNW